MDLRLVLSFAVPVAFILLIDYYAFQSVKTAFQHLSFKGYLFAGYWTITILAVLSILTYRTIGYKFLPHGVGTFIGAFVAISVLSKVVMILFLLGEDMSRIVRFAISKFSASPSSSTDIITRSQFLNRLAIMTAAVPFGTLLYGIIANAYNYQLHRVKIRFTNLPEAFNGFRIVQLSDIHTGSFTRTEPIQKAVETINRLNADVILFTGDLVNNTADEMEGYLSIFSKLQARLGVYSSTGNHDYGDYAQWSSKEAKEENFSRFIDVHRKLGWKLLMNEHHVFEKNGDKIALIGLENWGAGRWSKYGKFEKAYRGTEEIPFKIMMSHDPSNWDAKIRPNFPDIDLTLSGHTHGAQFGIESKWLKWSPSQWVYKQWAGLYQEGTQYLYVNRGFGFIGYPGRIGILPEITEITLVKA
ncbi:MAG: metallophosphoesterase [Bacteroidetes bacterium]|nr:metallophosphoesterase [Bacteroidota bacterium]